MAQLAEIEKLIAKNERALRNNKAKEGVRVRTAPHGRGWQYYFSTSNDDRKYAKVRERGKVREIVEREYEIDLKARLEILRDSLRAFLMIYDVGKIEEAYTGMCEAKKALIKPIIPTDEDFVANWYEGFNVETNSYPKSVGFETKRGEMVRSKSEKILADLFLDMGVPYVYEPKIKLKDGRNCYPDFALLNVRTRKTFWWEHLGMIDDEYYATKNLEKLYLYDKSEFVLGENLLLSMETNEMPIDIKTIKGKIKKYLL